MTSLKTSKKLKKLGFKAKHDKTWMQDVDINDKGIVTPAKTYTLHDGTCKHNGDLKLYPSYDADILYKWMIDHAISARHGKSIEIVHMFLSTYNKEVDKYYMFRKSQTSVSDILAKTVYKILKEEHYEIS